MVFFEVRSFEFGDESKKPIENNVFIAFDFKARYEIARGFVPDKERSFWVERIGFFLLCKENSL